VIDSYYPVAPELLLLTNGLKQVFSFGFAYNGIPWITAMGYQNAFGTMAGIQVGVILFGVPLYYFGKRIKHKSANWKVIYK
jgi:hypothetical protein